MNKRTLQNSFCLAMAAILALVPSSAFAMSQDETVYAKLDASGATNYISVTEHLLNDQKEFQLNDKTILEDIENLNGFEGFALNGENVIWSAEGKDIYYSGKTTRELPVKLQVTYKLDGEVKSIEEMLGKAGRVEIDLKYTNLSKVGELYTPFVAAVATTLPEDTARNITVTNGKAISNGRTIAVTAIAAPGLYESLKLSELQNLDEVNLTYDTDKFELNDIYTIVTPKVLDADDLKIFSELDQLYDDMDTLSDSSKKLLDGSSALRDGILKLRNAVADAKQQLNTNESLIDESTLDKISSTAASTARRKVAAQQDTIRAQIHQQVSGMISSDMIAQLNSVKQATINQTIAAKCNQTPSTTTAQNIAVQDSEANSDNDAATIDENEAPSEADDSGNNGSTNDNSDVENNNQTNAAYQACVKQVTDAVNSQFSSMLDTSAIETKLFNSTYGAMQQVAAETAAQTARSVATQVASSIQSGMGDKLDTLLGELLKGLDQLLDGANELTDGMYKFDDEGIQTLNNFVNGAVKNTSYKVQRLLKLADEYNNFAGIADGINGTTKFVLMIEARRE